MDEPIADAARAILDGHIVLSRALANRNQYPAIDISASISRVMRSIIPDRHNELAGKVKELMSVYAANEDLISIGAYVKGTNPTLDQAIAVIDRVRAYLRQGVNEKVEYNESVIQLEGILKAAGVKS